MCVMYVHRFDARLRESREGKTPKQRKFKRENKNRSCFAVHARERERNLFIQNLTNSISIIFTPRPREMSSHRPVSRFRQVLSVKKPAVRDPRFGERSGKYNPTMFKKAYGFIDEMKEKEKKMAEKELHKTKNPERKSQLHKLLQKMVCCAKPYVMLCWPAQTSD